MIRLTLAIADGPEDARPDLHDNLRYQLGTACLMVNDLLLTANEIRKIADGKDEERRKEFMAQMLAPMEILNPTPIRNLLFRSYILFRLLLHDDVLKNQIKRECKGLDLAIAFEKAAGLPVRKWLSLVFACYVGLIEHSRDELLQDAAKFIINRTEFIKDTAIGQQEMDLFLRTVTVGFGELRKETHQTRPVDERFDLIPFKSRPFFEVNPGFFATFDLSLLTEKLHTGVHWIIHDNLTRDDRWSLFSAWGLLFEAYVNWLLKGMHGKYAAIFYPSSVWMDGSKAFDGIFIKKRIFVALEYKGGFLSQKGKYSSDAQQLLQDLELKVGEGCYQLARNISLAFPVDPARCKPLQGCQVPSNIYRILPILIVQDHILGGVQINWWLNGRFQDYLRQFTRDSRIEVLPLTVIETTELELLVESTEAGGLDGLNALTLRCLQDREMKSELRGYLLALPGIGTRGAPRFDDAAKRNRQELIGYPFPQSATQAGNDEDGVSTE